MVPALNALTVLLATFAYLAEAGAAWTLVSSTCATVFIQNMSVFVPAMAACSVLAVGSQLPVYFLARGAAWLRFAAMPIPTLLSFFAGGVAAQTLGTWL